LGPRHWALLGLLAEHGAMCTEQVATLLFGSRPAAVRHLGVLTGAGLAWRFVHTNDATHTAFYEVSGQGVKALARSLTGEGRPVPVRLGAVGRDMFKVNDLFTRLAGDPCGHLYRWRRGLDAVRWLASHRIRGVRPAAFGVWIEAGVAVRFLLHVDHDQPAPVTGTPAPRPGRALSGYQRAAQGVPVSVILMLVPTPVREDQLHEDLMRSRPPVPVAVATFQRLDAATSAAGAIWRLDGVGPMLRLAELPDSAAREPNS
jgi:hypothetical protein